MSTRTQDISNTDDIIDIRDVIARVEELRELSNDESAPRVYATGSPLDTDALDELARLEALLEECADNGGDEQWEGTWYPVTLIRDDYFRTYAEELAEDIGAIDRKFGWPHTCIDWERAARELRMDYTAIEFDGVTYWTR